MKQHTGALSDAITDDDGREAAHHALKRVMKPTGKAFKGRSQVGNGEPCPWDAERDEDHQHGRMLRMESGRDWCPHVDHSSGKAVK